MKGRNGSESVGLLVTCLVDLFRPEVAFASANLIERQGFQVEVPEQTCCGQPAFNSGDRARAGINPHGDDAWKPFLNLNHVAKMAASIRQNVV